ncbi:amino acid ABC transporter permease [Thiospirochaeta perfilievii]|uniref:Amino acid ABC transporter permease n=1 Tax=Thiospirochaeta perfilievii TaxID=252967 RepID=A0A5C1Q8H1_9SPIO|nr:amino acid ABC transporter permease [Thiospirochaeta perfilievii]QEN03727.1 amino acid ABC transporter permease [Thiospirochaeta perfilievii]
MFSLKRYFLLKNPSDRPPRGAILLNFTIIFIFLAIFIIKGFSILDYDLRWDNVYKYKDNLLTGFYTTIVLSLISLLFSVIIGLFFGVFGRSRFLPLRVVSKIYIEIIRGTPLIVQILIFFYVVANFIGIDNRYVAGVIIMSFFSGAYIAEIIRAGVDSIGETQRETAKAIGLSKTQTYRYILFPQVLTRVLPPLAGQFASLIKDSSLLSIIAIKEFTMAAREINANTFSTIESYVPLAVGYLLLTIPISILTGYLERKFKYET